jgi:hypothetical protein
LNASSIPTQAGHAGQIGLTKQLPADSEIEQLRQNNHSRLLPWEENQLGAAIQQAELRQQVPSVAAAERLTLLPGLPPPQLTTTVPRITH